MEAERARERLIKRESEGERDEERESKRNGEGIKDKLQKTRKLFIQNHIINSHMI